MKTFKTPKGTIIPIMDIRGKDYLVVAQRLVWFREEHPDWSIETEIVMENENETTAKAAIKNEQGHIISTAHKYENKQGFPDHLEKAETGAIGRALGLAGYGTQFAPDLDEGSRLADAPVETDRNGTVSAGGAQGQSISSEPGVFAFGKWKGKNYSQVPFADAVDYSNWLMQSATKENKSLGKAQDDFCKWVNGQIEQDVK